MTYWESAFLPRHGQELFDRTIGEALALLVRHRWPRDTAKQIQRAWDIDPATAKNITKGHASERTITKAVKAEGWNLLEALGHAMTGQTYAEWEEARLNKIIEEAENAKEVIRMSRARRSRLAETSGVDVPGELRSFADRSRRMGG